MTCHKGLDLLCFSESQTAHEASRTLLILYETVHMPVLELILVLVLTLLLLLLVLLLIVMPILLLMPLTILFLMIRQPQPTLMRGNPVTLSQCIDDLVLPVNPKE